MCGGESDDYETGKTPRRRVETSSHSCLISESLT